MKQICDSIRVELNEEEIEQMTTDQKLNCLLKIAFSNHNKLMQHDEIFYGNGKKGILPTIQGHGYYIAGLWFAVTVLISVIVAVIVK